MYLFFCNKCHEKLNEIYNNNQCNECKNIYCNICIKNHINEKNNNIKEEFINLNTFNSCQQHNKKNYFFCEDCKYNICDDCKNEDVHKFHNIKSYLNLIVDKNKKNNIN